MTGRVRADKRAPGGYELDVDNVEVLQRVSEEEPFPITLKEHGVEFLMEHRHLWIRTPRQSAILRIRAEIIKAARDYLDDNGFVLTDRPSLRRLPAKAPAPCFQSSTSAMKPFSPRVASYISKARRWRWVRSILSVPPSRREVQDPSPPDRVLDGRA